MKFKDEMFENLLEHLNGRLEEFYSDKICESKLHVSKITVREEKKKICILHSKQNNTNAEH